MRRLIYRCLLPVLLAAFSAVPAAADTIVGQFYFERDICNFAENQACNPASQFQYFGTTNFFAIPDFTFSTVVQVQNGIDKDTYEFFDSGLSEGLRSQPFYHLLTINFTADDVLRFPGVFRLGNLQYGGPPPEGLAPTFQVEVVYSEGPVTVGEAPSWLVVVIGFSALVVGRALLV